MNDKNSYVKTINRQYLDNKIRNASQSEIITMLYDGTLNFLTQMKQAILEENHNVRDDAFGRVQAILQELQHCINYEEGGEIASSLASLYSFMLKHLFESNLNSDASGVEAIQEMIRELRSAWQEATTEQKNAANTSLPNQSKSGNFVREVG